MKRSPLNLAHPWLQADPRRLATYNAHDGVETAKLIAPLWAELEARPGNRHFYETELWPTVEVVLAMMDLGIPIDLAERTQLRRKFRREVATCDATLRGVAGPTAGDAFNPNSDTQVRRWLFGGDVATQPPGTPVDLAKGVRLPCLGLKPGLRTKEGAWSVAQDALLSVLNTHWRRMDEPHRPVLHALLHRSRFVKLDEYLDFETDDRGLGPRVYPTIKLAGTKSLRLAVAEPAVHSWASEVRPMVRARPGHTLVGADYSAIEARLAAYLSGDEADISIFERPDVKYHPDHDIHSATVLEVFRMTREEWAAIPHKGPYRDWAKQFRYRMLLYGGSADTSKEKVFCPCPKCVDKIPATLALSRTEQGKLAESWFARHPAFTSWRRQLARAFGPDGTRSVRMPSGWRSAFVAPWSADLQRELYNRPIQHTAAWCIMRAERRLHALGCPLFLQHHDALYAEVPEADAPAWQVRMVEQMQYPLPIGDRLVTFPVAAKLGPTWADLG